MELFRFGLQYLYNVGQIGELLPFGFADSKLTKNRVGLVPYKGHVTQSLIGVEEFFGLEVHIISSQLFLSASFWLESLQ